MEAAIRRGRLILETWAGRITYLVDIVDETPARFRIRSAKPISLPNRKTLRPGQTALVPKQAIHFKGS